MRATGHDDTDNGTPNMLPDATNQNIKLLKAENKKLLGVIEGLICWAGSSPDGPAWATPEAKAKNRKMFEDAMNAAWECFPEDYNGFDGDDDNGLSRQNATAN